jgi:hypothetical protein
MRAHILASEVDKMKPLATAVLMLGIGACSPADQAVRPEVLLSTGRYAYEAYENPHRYSGTWLFTEIETPPTGIRFFRKKMKGVYDVQGLGEGTFDGYDNGGGYEVTIEGIHHWIGGSGTELTCKAVRLGPGYYGPTVINIDCTFRYLGP